MREVLNCFVALLFVSSASGGEGASANALPAPSATHVDFVRDIQPIFAARCYACHGPEKQKSAYRLDSKPIALKGGDDHAPNILPGKSAESPLIRFVAGLMDEGWMPPQKKGEKTEPLSVAQVALLRAWIDQGADWPESADLKQKDLLDWWSLRPLKKLELPAMQNVNAALRNPIDRFIQVKLDEKKLQPAPEADRRTLIRRLSFDLTGLPPTPEEVGAFEKDADEHAYEKLVDRLLDSPRYGERWGRHWLDVVHYGDTHGYDKDQPRPNAWPYRDYAIRAFNADKPYRRFIEEQIAGDALFPGDSDGLYALGFIAAGPWDLIGHAEVPETKTDGKIARLLDRDDMVANTLNSFCGLTVQCARCHNHKFDPIKQEDYYRLQAVFAALDRADRPVDADAKTTQRRQELTARERELKAGKKELDARILKGSGAELADLDKKIEALSKPANEGINPAYGYHSHIVLNADAAKWVQVDLGESRVLEEVALCGCNDSFNNIGAGFGFPARFKIDVSDDPEFKTADVIADRTQEDFKNPGVLPQRFAANGKRGRFVRVTATKLAPRSNDFIFALAEFQAFDATKKNVALNGAVTALDSIEAPVRWSKKNLTDGVYPASKEAGGNPDELAALKLRRDALLDKALGAAGKAEQTALENNLRETHAELVKLPPAKMVYAGTIHYGSGAFSGTGPNGGKPRAINILARGDVRKPLDEVGPGVPALIRGEPVEFKLPADAPESARRAALAKWLTDPRNPLTWRTIVNRVWHYHFGRGLADSPNDLGRMGRTPSHPELLDWLAADFRDNGQSIKALHRLIVTSAAYRRASTGNAQNEKIDANNEFLWRMNRRKLEAESVRDSILFVAGKLDLKMGGPGFQDFKIEKPEHSPHYEYALSDPEDAATQRRSVYRFLVRSQPQPFMSALDCADPSVSVDKRNATLTALQALALLNDKLSVAMARHFAARVEKLAPDVKGRIAAALRIALSREPLDSEIDSLSDYVQRFGLPAACRVIVNLNEFSFVD